MPSISPRLAQALASMSTTRAPAPRNNGQPMRNAPARPAARQAPRTRSAAPAAPAAQKVKLDAIVQQAVAAAMKAYDEGQRAPAVHTGGRDTKDRIDDEARELLGDERYERRRESEARYLEHPARSSTSVEEIRGSYGDDRRRGDRGNQRREVGLDAAEFVMWLTRAKGDPDRAERMAKKAGAAQHMIRALGESTFQTGGALVPQNIATDYIDLLYNTSAFLKAGPQRVTVPNGNLTIPKLTKGANVYWVGESQNLTPSQQESGSVRVDLKTVGTIVPASNMFVNDAGIDALRMIKEDIATKSALEIDACALRSLGTQWRPRGLRGWVPTSNTFQSTGTSIVQITADIMKAIGILEQGQMPMSKVAVFMSSRTKLGLMGARDAQNRPVWAEEMARGTFYGMPFFWTQHIPNDVGTGGNKSEIYVVDMSQIIFADDPQGVRIDVSTEAAYYDGSGVVSPFSRDEVVTRILQRCDVVSRRDGREIAEIYDVAIA